MRYLVGAVAMAPFAAMLVAMVRGRVRARSCCAADADHDLRLRDNHPA
jgi:hypothetical protein